MKNRLCLFFIVFFYIYDKIYSYTGGELIDFESKSYEDNQRYIILGDTQRYNKTQFNELTDKTNGQKDCLTKILKF